jgi:hypothetical protein
MVPDPYERSPGVFEIRIVVGREPVTGVSVQRSFTVRGDGAHAEARRRELVADYGLDLSLLHASGMTVGELLTRWLRAGHSWKSSTVISYESDARALRADAIASVRLCAVNAASLHRTIGRWQAIGMSVATVASRCRTLGSAMRWAVEQGILRTHPFAGMRRPRQPLPRLPLSMEDVELLLATAAKLVEDARADAGPGRRRLFEAEQTEVLVRLAADSGARRGELARPRSANPDGHRQPTTPRSPTTSTPSSTAESTAGCHQQRELRRRSALFATLR